MTQQHAPDASFLQIRRRHDLTGFVCAVALALCGSQALAYSVDDWDLQAAGSGAYQATYTGETNWSATNYLVTSNPSKLTGPSVATLIGADRFYDEGITGQGTVSANVEAGHIWSGHETLGHVSTFVNDASTWDTDSNPATPEYDRHATFVSGMIGGRNGGTTQGDWQPGIAPGTDLQSGAIANSWNPNAYSYSFDITSLGALTTPYETYFGQADVINSSWGGTDPGGSGIISVYIDSKQSGNPGTTMVAAAGNAGPSGNSVGSPGSGYNTIAVGALSNDGSNNYDTVALFSSRGPQDYWDPVNGTISGVRAAVDIAAPGDTLTAAFYGGQTGGNNPSLPGSNPTGTPSTYWADRAGTSYSSPITAGAVALIKSSTQTDPELQGNARSRDTRVVKAALLNSARKIPGWDNGQSLNAGVIETTQSLDWDSGAGAVDLDRAYDQFFGAGTRDLSGTGGGNASAIGWDYGEVGFGTTNSYVIDQILTGGTTFRATLSWFRDQVYNGGTSFTLNGQADLDLIVRNLTTGVVAQSISAYNTVEHLSFLLPSTGQYAIDVLYGANTFGDITSTAYGLAWWGVAEPTEIPDIPLPGTLVLLLGGAGALLIRRRRPDKPRPFLRTAGQ